MNPAKKIIRNVIYPTMMGLKIDKFLRLRTDKKLLNIMYHGVVKEDSTYFSPRHILETQFEKQIKYLTKEFDVLSVYEAFDVIKNNIPLKRKSVTISFDDGYLNNLSTALPILEHYNAKTTFFVCSACTTDMHVKTLWPDLLAAIQFFYRNEIIQVNGFIFKNQFCSDLKISLSDYIKTIDCQKRDLILDQLISEYKLKEKFESLPKEIWLLMNDKELKQLASSKIVDIGSHGHLHYNLGNIDPLQALEDMKTSVQLLEKCISRKVDLIAYPDGNYTEYLKNEAEKMGFKGQMAVQYKLESDLHDTRILNRHGVSGTTTYASTIINLNAAFKSKGI